MKNIFKKIIKKIYFKTYDIQDIQWQETFLGPRSMTVLYCNNFEEICNIGKYAIDKEELIKQYSFIVIELKLDKSYAQDIVNLLISNLNKRYTAYNNFIVEDVMTYYRITFKGNLHFYKDLSEIIPYTVITNLINPYIFPNRRRLAIEQRFLHNYVYTLKFPNKKCDILFIEEDNTENPVIGLTFDPSIITIDSPSYENYTHKELLDNARICVVDELKSLTENIPEAIEIVQDKLSKYIHTNIKKSDPYDEVDEIIED